MLVLLGAASVFGHDDEHEGHPVKVDEARVWSPTPVPDRIVLTWSADPARTQDVTFRTDTSVTRAFGQIAVAEGGPLFVNQIIEQRVAETESLKTNLGDAHFHTVRFANLQPKTKYAYRVGDGVNWSEWSHFDTASDQSDPFSFVYFGDAQNELKSHWSRVVREAFRDAPRAAFFLHAGDLVNRAESDGEWGEWFYAGGFINRTIPVIATPGNHEYSSVDESGESVRRLSHHWRPQFSFPQNGPSELTESTFWLDFQGVRIVSLNSNERQAAQVEWLDQTLANAPRKWTILTFHHPIYSSKSGRDNPELRELWQPLFDKHKVDLVLQGHDHTYARTKLMQYRKGSIDEIVGRENLPTGTVGRGGKAGTVYVVSVSGPKMYELGKRPFMARTAENTQLYQIISVDGDVLSYEARTAVGTLYDAFTLTKQPDGQPNLLTHELRDVAVDDAPTAP